MPIQFKRYPVTFQRTVVEEQTIEIAQDARIDEQTARLVAEQLAVARLKKTGWDAIDTTEPAIVAPDPARNLGIGVVKRPPRTEPAKEKP